ncbi:hypothetical protein [Curtobacterium sp. MCBD17_008]|uniref:hypothetical protein n=1 Tax=Curtobacterium sp. MCBD17_008 TaxID=2175656 RepID=UPI000DA9DA08|nr:hypothetical protein [Curtobacterium sp. MCBD17_008]PZE89943.1 hypothetical protein DEI95_13045 [Curtobacterium sp. MCBD17_008]
MGTTIRIEMNQAGIRELLKSDEVRADLEARANRIAAAAGGEPDYEVDVRQGSSRVRASVRTATFPAILDEARNRTLSGSLDAGR